MMLVIISLFSLYISAGILSEPKDLLFLSVLIALYTSSFVIFAFSASLSSLFLARIFLSSLLFLLFFDFLCSLVSFMLVVSIIFSISFSFSFHISLLSSMFLVFHRQCRTFLLSSLPIFQYFHSHFWLVR